MIGEHRIITYGLTDEQNKIVKANAPARDYEILDTDVPTDILAISSIAIIIQASELDEDSADMLFDYYTQINGCTYETVIWLGNPKPPKELRKFFKCYPSFADIEDNLKYILLNAHSKSKKTADFSEKLQNSLLILSTIRKKPGVTTNELSEKFGLPVRTVQRYIAAIKATGEWIEYDQHLKGWKLYQGISILFGDAWDGEYE